MVYKWPYQKNFSCPTSQLLYASIFAYLTLRLPSRLIRTCPQPTSYSATGGAQARAELPKKWKVFYTVVVGVVIERVTRGAVQDDVEVIVAITGWKRNDL